MGSILEPGRPPRTDKCAILVDAVRMVTQLRGESQKLKDSNSNLQDKIKELKVNYTLLENTIVAAVPFSSSILPYTGELVRSRPVVLNSLFSSFFYFNRSRRMSFVMRNRG